MDTRGKIMAWDQFAAAAAEAPALVTGYFDPLTAAHADELEQLAAEHGPLYVAITDPPAPVLPAMDRAVLVAALRAVAAVAVLAGPASHRRVISLEAADLERRRELTAHVLSRHQPAVKS